MGINNFIIAGIIILILIMGVGIYEGIIESDSELNISQEIKNISYEYLSEVNDETLADNLLIDVEPLEELEDMFPNTTELHWNHMPLTYNYYNCSQTTIDRIVKATEFITNKTESITFEFQNIETPDISFICMSEVNQKNSDILALAKIYYYEKINTYAPSKILIYPVNNDCLHSNPITEVHEILHLLGLEHPSMARSYDIMNPESIDCSADISEKDLEYLKGIYG